MTEIEEMKVFAYRNAIIKHEEVIKVCDELIMLKDYNIELTTLVKYKKAIVTVEKYEQLIREITGEEL